MKLIRLILMALLVMAVSSAVPAVAQHDHDGDRHEKDRDDDRDNGPGHGHGRGNAYGHEKHEDRDWHHERDARFVRYEEHEGHHHRRIPEDHFRAHFGREHRFVIVRPVIVAGHPRFQYDGYWFAIAAPLPRGWRYSDEVYVDYVDDNYYVCSPAHPGVHISINIL
jgi:Ni/Co efflux regulator RcnB